MDTLLPAFIGIPGGPEMLVILLLVVLLFGADKLPKLARSSGQAMGEFKRGRDQIEDDIREAAEATPDRTDVESAERV
ncbi:Sec-independent protein translocase subunit TatA/TatB [Halobellus marinus]|jgi:sec-independent protein translocase protein TatA|uniref:Sec-independent protein translocase subunit TatA/TatB n=1 Tax=Halobellus TaxID=1073986 RepID=UPI0028A94C2F|nr:twin-arginine translocase TatA/TatE family subunit [Halobellus sp. DFY28]